MRRRLAPELTSYSQHFTDRGRANAIGPALLVGALAPPPVRPTSPSFGVLTHTPDYTHVSFESCCRRQVHPYRDRIVSISPLAAVAPSFCCARTPFPTRAHDTDTHLAQTTERDHERFRFDPQHFIAVVPATRDRWNKNRIYTSRRLPSRTYTTHTT